ncbi:MAG: hypothetical protein GF421_02175 [Candidatus Aminicenantes bacterium]|nr:hypothetical protein [Candidatus Aminicenantes bacterium]
MKCIPALELYLFLERELSDRRKAEIKTHLSSCPKCQESLEKRKSLVHAMEHIPSLQTPRGFSKQVLSRINPLKPSLSECLKAAAAAFVFISLLGFVFLAFSSHSLADLIVQLFQSIIHSSQEALILGIKFIKTISIFVNAFLQLTRLLIQNILAVFTVLSTEIQIFAVLISVLMAIGIIFYFKQKYILGDKG